MQDSMAQISGREIYFKRAGKLPKAASDCAITHRAVCVPVMKKEGRRPRR